MGPGEPQGAGGTANDAGNGGLALVLPLPLRRLWSWTEDLTMLAGRGTGEESGTLPLQSRVLPEKRNKVGILSWDRQSGTLWGKVQPFPPNKCAEKVV